jgi:hypothetical protein
LKFYVEEVEGFAIIHKYGVKDPPKDLVNQVEILDVVLPSKLNWYIFTQLRQITIRFYPAFDEKDQLPYFIDILKTNPHLELVSLFDYRGPPEPLEEALSKLPKLKHLHLGGSVYFDLSKCLQLRTMEASLKDLSCLRTLHHLKKLRVALLQKGSFSTVDLSSCERLEHVQAWAYSFNQDDRDIFEYNRSTNERRRDVKLILLCITGFPRDVINEIIKEV